MERSKRAQPYVLWLHRLPRTLQGKVSPFGVEVLNVKITDVFLPRELQERLEKTTAFATRIAEEEKNHNYAVQQLTNVHAQSMAAIKQKV